MLPLSSKNKVMYEYNLYIKYTMYICTVHCTVCLLLQLAIYLVPSSFIYMLLLFSHFASYSIAFVILGIAIFMIEQKGMTFDHNFCYSFYFLLPPFLVGKRKGDKNNQSRGQKSCLSARSIFIIIFFLKAL